MSALVLGCTFANATELVAGPAGAAADGRDVATQVRAALEPSFVNRCPTVVGAVVDQTLATPRHPELDRAMIEQFLSHDRNDLGTIDVPTIVLCGDRDRVFPLVNSQRIADAIPSAAMRVLPGVGHAVQFEGPDALTSAIELAVAASSDRQ